MTSPKRWTGYTVLRDFEKIYLYPQRLLGAQALGGDGVDKRISALAMAIQMGGTIYDLEEAELCSGEDRA